MNNKNNEIGVKISLDNAQYKRALSEVQKLLKQLFQTLEIYLAVSA